MIELPSSEWDVHRLNYSAIGLEMVLDRRFESITFHVSDSRGGHNGAAARNGDGRLTIRFKRFRDFEDDLNNLDAELHGALKEKLNDLAKSRATLSNKSWKETLGNFAFSLLRYGRKHHGDFETVAQKLLGWVGAEDARTAWRSSYNDMLTFEHRYKLLSEARQALSDGAARVPESDTGEIRDQELFWWTTLCCFDVASEWVENEGRYNLKSRRALREASINYLQMLKDEQRRRDLARFLSECGTDVETQVKHVLFGKKTDVGLKAWVKNVRAWAQDIQRRFLKKVKKNAHHIPVAEVFAGEDLVRDEVIRRTFFIWFLRRYDLKSAGKLIFKVKLGRERVKVARWVLFAMNSLALILLLVQFAPAPAPRPPLLPSLAAWLVDFVTAHATGLWASQVFLQLISLGFVLLLAPSYFRLLMPRALFGSLLAWTTIVITALPDLRDVKTADGGFTVGQTCHATSLSAELYYSLPIGAGFILLSSIFVAYTITQFISSRSMMLSRTLMTTGRLLLGSAFWSAIFALPAKYVLESGERPTPFMFDCFSLLPIVVIGTPVAILFGLLVQLIWEDASLAEPIGEPL